MSSWALTLYAATVLLLLLIYYIHISLQKRAADFQQRGIPYLGSMLGKNWRLITGSLNPISFHQEIYQEARKSSSKVVALSDMFGQSTLLVMDLDLIRDLKIKDFDHFVNNRDFQATNTGKYFSRMLFCTRDEQWKRLRNKLTPAFSTGKTKRMFQIFQKSSQNLVQFLQQHENVDLDFCQVFQKYSMDVIAHCAFGMDPQTWQLQLDELSTFEQFSKQLASPMNGFTILKLMVMLLLPKLADILNLELMNSEGQEYFAGVIKTEIERRRRTGETRDDFLQGMLDAQNGLLDNHGEFTDEDLTANAIMFFLAGYDTTQSALIFTAYSLAVEKQVQNKLYVKLNAAKKKSNGLLTNEAIRELRYLDWIVNETLRIHPASVHSERQCSTDYTAEEDNLLIKKNEIVTIPHHGIHMDSRYWPNPTKFHPERFSPDNKAPRHPLAFMPFGHGPRACPASRFAMLKVKTAIACLISEYEVLPCAKTQIPPVYASNHNAKPKDGMWLKIVRRPEN